jgi:membrane fusion protein, protease secretion system
MTNTSPSTGPEEQVADVTGTSPAVVSNIAPGRLLDEKTFSRLGWIVVIVGVLGFILWGAFAPLDQGVPVPGTVVVDGSRKAVQHPTGGIVDEILVAEGDVVKAGQVLVRMNSTQAKAQAEILRSQLVTAQAVQARLLAERDNLPEPVFPAELLARRNDPAVGSAIALQRQLFSSRRAAVAGDLSATQEAIRGLEAQQQGIVSGRESRKLQQASLKEQLANTRELAELGYVPRNRMLEIDRQYAQINAALTDDQAALGRLQSQALELKLRVIQRRDEYQKEVRTQLTEIQRDAETLASRLTAAEFEMANTEVKAPAEGIVVGLGVTTNGGVVPPGFRMMDVVPQNQPLEIDGQVPVHLIDKVHPGLVVDMLFPALNQNKTPRVSGEVTVVSADRLIDEATRQPYYKLKAKVNPEGMKQLARQQIRPGMPVQVFVKTGERSLFSYLFKPIRDRAATALSEE